MRVTGAKLNVITQTLAYQIIVKLKNTNEKMERRRTSRNLELIKNTIEERYGFQPTDEAYWKSIRHKDFAPKTRYFLWVSTHDAYMIGTHWLRSNYSDDLQSRAECQQCHEIENLDHILTKCQTPGQHLIWEMAGELWDKKQKSAAWSTPLLGEILGCGLAEIKKPNSEK